MKQGFLYYAHNNEKINYLRLALCSALTGNYFISNFNATVVTDDSSLIFLSKQEKTILEKIANIKINNDIYSEDNNPRPIISGYDNIGTFPWRNRTRSDAFVDSPYDETILVDVDYIFQDNNTEKLWGSKIPLKMNKNVIPIGLEKNKDVYLPPKDTMVGEFTIPTYWATLVYFNKSGFVENFFNLVNHIKLNYLAYCGIYGTQNTMYRNDFAFSIALYMNNGFIEPGKEYELPFKYVLTLPEAAIHQIDVGVTRFLYPSQDWRHPWQYLNLNDISYHCMNKISLQEKIGTFIQFYGDHI